MVCWLGQTPFLHILQSAVPRRATQTTFLFRPIHHSFFSSGEDVCRNRIIALCVLCGIFLSAAGCAVRRERTCTLGTRVINRLHVGFCGLRLRQHCMGRLVCVCVCVGLIEAKPTSEKDGRWWGLQGLKGRTRSARRTPSPKREMLHSTAGL